MVTIWSNSEASAIEEAKFGKIIWQQEIKNNCNEYELADFTNKIKTDTSYTNKYKVIKIKTQINMLNN